MKSLPFSARHIYIPSIIAIILLISTSIATASPIQSDLHSNPAQPVTLTEQQNTVHVVRWGETLGSIAQRYGVSIAALAQANGIVNVNLIFVGQTLFIPTGTDTGGTPTNPTPTPGTTPSQGSGTVHVVSPGDTLFRISLRYGVTVQAIMSANGLFNPNLIFVGQTLNIPGTTVTNPTPANPTPIPSNPSNPAPSTSEFMFGGQTQSFASADLMKDIGMNWVKFQHKWGEGDTPGIVTGRIKQAHDANLKVLLSIPGANTYPSSINFNDYVEFLRGVAQLDDPPDAIEIWNEMNIDFEWPEGQIDPSSYVNNMLRPAYQAIKGANSSILVISGAPAPTGFDNSTNAWADDRYMRGLAAAGGTAYMDCVGVHFNAGATSPTVSSGHPADSTGHYSWYYSPMVTTYWSATGGRKPLCFTEIGYLTSDGFPGLPPNFSWAANTTIDNHGTWLAEALQLAKNDSRVAMFVIFNVDFQFYDQNGDPQAGYGIVRPNGTCPACGKLKPIGTN